MVKLINEAVFPDSHMNCYESVMITLFKYFGLQDEAMIMGAPVYFILDPVHASILPRTMKIQDEWKRLFKIELQGSRLTEDRIFSLINEKLDSRVPVCLELDLYWLDYTPHYLRFHQNHLIDLFGYENDRYYFVCPYYRHEGWIDTETINKSVFTRPDISECCFLFIDKLTIVALSENRVIELLQDSCKNMLGITNPEEVGDKDGKYIGLEGIKSLNELIIQLSQTPDDDEIKNKLISLSREIISVGNSRYWFQKFIALYQKNLFTTLIIRDLEKQINEISHYWRSAGQLLSKMVYTNNFEDIKLLSRYFDSLYKKEYHLYVDLLGSLPGNEEGIL